MAKLRAPLCSFALLTLLLGPAGCDKLTPADGENSESEKAGSGEDADAERGSKGSKGEGEKASGEEAKADGKPEPSGDAKTESPDPAPDAADAAKNSPDQAEAAAQVAEAAANKAQSQAGLLAAALAPVEPDGPKPTKFQSGFKMSDAKFLGWTSDGHRFVIEATYGFDDTHDTPDYVRVVEVHDALTGLVVERYLMKKEESFGDPKHKKMVKDSEPKKKWAARETELALVAAEPKPKSPDGKWSLELASTTSKGPQGTKFKINDDPSWRWTGLVEADLPKLKRQKPKFQVTLRSDEESHEVLNLGLGLSLEEAVSSLLSPDSGLKGRFEAYWSPSGERVVIMAITRCHLDVKEQEFNTRAARWFVRGLGPQIRVVNSGSTEALARRVAAKLHAGGFPVTVLDPAGKALPASEIYFRSALGMEFANKINVAIGGRLPTKPLTDDGWTDIVLLVGADAGELDH